MARGSIKQRGTVWYVIVPYTDPATGAYKRKWLRVSGELGYPNTRRGAEKALAAQINDLNQGKRIDPSRTTVAAFLDDWLAGRLHVRASTLYKDRLNVTAAIVPHLGEIELRRLTPTHVRQWHAALLERMKPVTIQRIHQTLLTALNTAVEDHVIRENVAARVRPPKAEKRPPVVWTVDQIEMFLTACEDDRYGVLWALIVKTGMRRGEALALRWEDVDLTNARLTVRRTVTSDANGRRIVGPPKTASSHRTIDLAESSVRALQLHQDAQRFLKASPIWQEHGLVFCKTNGTMLRTATLLKALDRTVERAALPRLTIHGLRHTHATWLMAAGVHPKVASERLGHSRVGITLDLYSHVSETMQRDAVERIENTLGSKSGSSVTTDAGSS